MNTEGTLDYQIGLEKRIAHIYDRIANQFLSAEDNNQKRKRAALWKNLARDESDHATLLSIEKALLQTGVRVKKPVEMNREMREELDLLLTECDQKVAHGVTEAEAVEILMSIESYDNRFFKSLLKATDSKLLSRFATLSRSFKAHEARVQEGLGICSTKQETPQLRGAGKESGDV